MMKKVLIWDTFPLSNSGGPNGYLYNIHEYLRKYPTSQITFLSDILGQQTKFSDNIEVKKRNRTGIFTFFRIIYNYCWRVYRLCDVIIPSSIDLNEYDFIHVHSINQVLGIRKKYPSYHGKIIVTSHCPCLWIDEMLTILPRWAKYLRPFAILNECASYDSADYIMFPCKDAREPYEKDKRISRCFKKNEDKFFYVPSSILDLEIDERKIQKFEDLGIPKDSFVITYFGRHNEIKGYDILKEVGKSLLDKYPNLYFLCAGRGPIAPLKHRRWIELGFINNTNELLYQSDLYILPNRETYFDLVVLEILRSSTRLIFSDTGGNKFFKTLQPEETSELYYFDIDKLDDLLLLVECAIKEKELSAESYNQKGNLNRQLFLKYFTIETYMNNYIRQVNDLM